VAWIKAVAPVSQAEMVPFKLAKMKCAELPSPPFFTGKAMPPETLHPVAKLLLLLTWPVGPWGPVAVVGILTMPFPLMGTLVTVVLSVTI